MINTSLSIIFQWASLSPEEQIHYKQCHTILPQYQCIPADGCRTLQFYHHNALGNVKAWQKFKWTSLTRDYNKTRVDLFAF